MAGTAVMAAVSMYTANRSQNEAKKSREAAEKQAETARADALKGEQEAKQQQEEDYIKYIYNTFIDPQNHEDKIELMRQYIEKFESFMPPAEFRRSPEELASHAKELIKTHVQVINNIRSSMRRFS